MIEFSSQRAPGRGGAAGGTLAAAAGEGLAARRRAALDARLAAFGFILHLAAQLSYLHKGGETAGEVAQRLASLSLGVTSWALPLTLVRGAPGWLLRCAAACLLCPPPLAWMPAGLRLTAARPRPTHPAHLTAHSLPRPPPSHPPAPRQPPAAWARWRNPYMLAFRLAFFGAFPLMRQPRGIQRVRALARERPSMRGVWGGWGGGGGQPASAAALPHQHPLARTRCLTRQRRPGSKACSQTCSS